jgi:hypothetical protein
MPHVSLLAQGVIFITASCPWLFAVSIDLAMAVFSVVVMNTLTVTTRCSRAVM